MPGSATRTTWAGTNMASITSEARTSLSGDPSSDTVTGILAGIRASLPAHRPLPLHEPRFAGNEWVRVKDCLDSGWVSSVGAYVDRFETSLSEYTGIPHAIATVNGTAALHTCLLLAGVQAGDEVLLPALTFVGTANPVAAMGAIPHFVDCEHKTLGIDPEALAAHLAQTTELRDGVCHNRHTGRPLRALLVVHVLGHIADMPRLKELADRYRLVLIEDAAEALGSHLDGRHAGFWGDLSALSFNGNKIITTGGGGAILTRNKELARHARHLTTTAKQPHPWAFEHDEVGFNYRMPNLNAALGMAQMEQLPALLTAKRQLYRHYREVFSNLSGVRLFREPEQRLSNHWLNLLLLEAPAHRDELLQAAHAEGLHLRPFWTPLHHLRMYQDCPRADLAVSDDLFHRGICLPSSAQLGGTPAES